MDNNSFRKGGSTKLIAVKLSQKNRTLRQRCLSLNIQFSVKQNLKLAFMLWVALLIFLHFLAFFGLMYDKVSVFTKDVERTKLVLISNRAAAHRPAQRVPNFHYCRRRFHYGPRPQAAWRDDGLAPRFHRIAL